VGRPQLKSKGAKRTTIYLNPAEDFALNFIENSRRIREDGRYQPSEIIADALWLYLEQKEGKTREQLTALLPVPPKALPQSNVREFRKKDKKS
jgi:hypothetical protein